MSGDRAPRLMPSLAQLLCLPEPPGSPYLLGSRCSACGLTTFPPRQVCPACVRDDTMAQVPLSRRGKIDTFTISRVAPPGFEAPYIQAFVLLPEGPRIFSLITGCPPQEGAVEMGQEVELVVERLCRDEGGQELLGYKFRPVQA